MCLTVHVISLGHVYISSYWSLFVIGSYVITHCSVFIVLTCVLIVSGWPHSILWLALCVPVSCNELCSSSRKFVAYRPFGAYRFCISVFFLLVVRCFFCFVLFSVHYSLFLCFSLFLTKIRKWKGVTWRVGCNPTCPYDSFLVRNWVGRTRPWQTVCRRS